MCFDHEEKCEPRGGTADDNRGEDLLDLQSS